MRPTAYIIFGLLLGAAKALAAPIVSVQPSLTTVAVGQAFSVAISASSAVDLYAFELDFGFNPSVLTATSVTEGPFLGSAGATFFLPGVIDNAAGTIAFTADSLLAAVPGATGSGALAFVNFTAAAAGTSSLNAFDVVLLDSQLAGITFTTQGGTVVVNGPTAPEPGTLILFATGTLLLVTWRRRKVRAPASSNC